MAIPSLNLKTAIESYPHVQALRDGAVTIPGASLEFVDISPVHRAFKPMVERLEFDVCEMAISTYLVAKAFGKQITGLPVILARQFHHRSISYNVNSGIREPKDLEGKKVGMRSYAQTTPLWVRGILSHGYGVDLSKVTWVTYEGSHVAEYADPVNAVRAPEGKSLDGMLASREIDAAIGARGGAPEIQRLVPDTTRAEEEWYSKTGVYPINHMVVVKSSLVEEYPWLLGDLFQAFKAAKEVHLARLRDIVASGADVSGDVADPSKPWLLPVPEQLRLQRMLGGDHIPYGVEANRRAIETAVQFAVEQQLIPRPIAIDELFDESILSLQ